MSKNLRFAVIGAGRIGLVHAGSVFDTKGAELVYIVDPIKEAADKIAAQFDCKVATDPVAVINSGEIDAVIIGSPTPTHVPLLSAAIDAGVHALCEKPIDLDMKNVDALREKANKAKTHVSIGFNRPHDPQYGGVRQRVAAGEQSRSFLRRSISMPCPWLSPYSFKCHVAQARAIMLLDQLAEG